MQYLALWPKKLRQKDLISTSLKTCEQHFQTRRNLVNFCGPRVFPCHASRSWQPTSFSHEKMVLVMFSDCKRILSSLKKLSRQILYRLFLKQRTVRTGFNSKFEHGKNPGKQFLHNSKPNKWECNSVLRNCGVTCFGCRQTLPKQIFSVHN